MPTANNIGNVIINKTIANMKSSIRLKYFAYNLDSPLCFTDL